jgi:hypothetical protein
MLDKIFKTNSDKKSNSSIKDKREQRENKSTSPKPDWSNFGLSILKYIAYLLILGFISSNFIYSIKNFSLSDNLAIPTDINKYPYSNEFKREAQYPYNLELIGYEKWFVDILRSSNIYANGLSKTILQFFNGFFTKLESAKFGMNDLTRVSFIKKIIDNSLNIFLLFTSFIWINIISVLSTIGGFIGYIMGSIVNVDSLLGKILGIVILLLFGLPIFTISSFLQGFNMFITLLFKPLFYDIKHIVRYFKKYHKIFTFSLMFLILFSSVNNNLNIGVTIGISLAILINFFI